MIGIIFISDIKYCPYLDKYTQILNSQNQEFEVLFWHREKSDRYYPSNFISYNYESEKNRLPIYKSFDFLRYRNWLIKEIRQKKYKKVIILSTLSGMIISGILLKEFKNKYILDIRDYSYEKNPLFFNIEKKVIENSYFTCISSSGFKEFLPKDKPYITVHNFNKNEIEHKKVFRKKDKGETLKLVFIGGVRYFEHQKKIIDKLKNDERFEMVYHGSGTELDSFIEYCKETHVNNIVFTGEYDNKNKHELLENADILNNSYKTKKFIEVKYAISNKYYDGLIYGIPQLIETKTYKQKKVEDLNIGLGIDENDHDFSDKLHNFYFSINENNFNLSCDKELNKIIEEDHSYSQEIIDFIGC